LKRLQTELIPAKAELAHDTSTATSFDASIANSSRSSLARKSVELELRSMPHIVLEGGVAGDVEKSSPLDFVFENGGAVARVS